MKRYFQILIILMVTFISLQCKKDLGVLSPNLLLKYELMSGWAGKFSIITVSRDYSAVKNMDNMETTIEFSSEEKEKLEYIISKYSSFKRFYQPENGGWVDIDIHELIYYGTTQPDSISIYEPLNSPEIPRDLVELVNLLRSKMQ